MRTLQENGKTFVLVPLKEYERLSGKREKLSDVDAFDAAIERGEEAFPITLFDAMDAGASPIMVFREYRSMTQRKLARLANISAPYLSQLESGAREGSLKAMKAIANALNVPMDMLT